ncbi:MAG TPA: DUF934 domain-containing protein [Hyphomonadaceae bacterium]|nr:DUF934 domain-containing protein [Hyphomonadaceae bacterium]
MPLLKSGKIVDDVWAFVEDAHELSPGGCITVSLARFLSEHEQLLHRNRTIGVRLTNTDDPALLGPFLDQIHLVELQFPKYTDGRAFSQSQLLRRRLGYKGEVRAIGQVLRDQLRLMIRSGFDAMVIDEKDAEAVYDFSEHEFSEFYQSASDAQDTIFLKRHRKRQEKAAQ